MTVRISLKQPVAKTIPRNAKEFFEQSRFAFTDSTSTEATDKGLKVIGYTIFKRLRKVLVPVDVLPDLWLDSGLPKQYLPSRPEGSDVFRTAATETFNFDEKKYIVANFSNKILTTEHGDSVILNGEHKIRLLLRPAKGDNTEILRLVIREIISPERKTLFHGPAMTLRWDKAEKAYTIKYFPGILEEYDYKVFENRFKELFDLYMNHYGRPVIARMIWAVLSDNKAIEIFDQSGFYFISQEYEHIAHSIKKFIELLAPYATEVESNIDRVPQCQLATTVDTKHDREIIENGVINEARRVLNEINLKIQKRQQEGRPVTKAMIRDFIEAKEKLNKTLDYYRQLLDAEIDVAYLTLHTITAKISELSSQV